MVTRLQEEFCRSRIFRDIMGATLTAEGIPAGYKGLLNGIYEDVFCDLPEPFIKGILFTFLGCEDITPQERAEALRLLRLSSTAFTRQQIARVKYAVFGGKQ